MGNLERLAALQVFFWQDVPMAVNRVQVIWTGGFTVGGGLSTFYFDSLQGTPAQQVAAVAAFLAGTEDRRGTGILWTTSGDVATLNVASGALEDTTAVTQSSGVGTLTGDALPPQTQGLLRLITGDVVGGRLLRGRMFLPGNMESQNDSGGVPSAAYRGDYDTNAANLIADTNTAWIVWSQTHGAIAPVLSANTWTRWASLRSRRD